MNDLIEAANELAEYLDDHYTDITSDDQPNWAMRYAMRLREAAREAAIAERLREVERAKPTGEVAKDMAATLRTISSSMAFAARTKLPLSLSPTMRKRIDDNLEKYEATIGGKVRV